MANFQAKQSARVDVLPGHASGSRAAIIQRRVDIQRRIDAHPEQINQDAAQMRDAQHSARSPTATWLRFVLWLVFWSTLVGALLAPITTALSWLAVLTVFVGLTSLLRLLILLLAVRDRPLAHSPALPDKALPGMTLFIALYRESDILPQLLEALSTLDYPTDKLEIWLLLESDDRQTREALGRLTLPDTVAPLILPPGSPRTKPRALNAALPFASHEIIGIYDAEDCPAPDQLRKVAQSFADAPPNTACVQARLWYYNARENWLSRCFAIEYAMWFDLLLAGLRRLALPVPLGGTSVFIKTSILREIGGWDAHNVTEDAELGLTLARAGYRCALVDSTTLEEANCQTWPWIRQRSRWVKGYAQTWLTHMSRPTHLVRDLGLWGFVGAQILFLASLLAALGQPVFWILLLWRWLPGLPQHPLASISGDWLWPLAIVLLSGQIAVLLTAMLAVSRRKARWLLPWCLTLPFYWPLGAIAAYKALAELLVAPFFWDKTAHGSSSGRPPGANQRNRSAQAPKSQRSAP
ncbi:MAG: glycosyltransferase [Neomegalonema sp.]|nr:glycosyltransferase [Neomegalonema sp.]